MRDEIEAAALFITKLVNKNLSNACSTSSSIHHSHSSSASSSLSSSSSTSSASSSSSTSSDSPPDFDEQNPTVAPSSTTTTTATITSATATSSATTGGDQDKVVQFRQCLEEALYERFHNHWFPEQPTKGQAYRCIRLNEWDRRDITLQKVCTQCGIDYKDLQLPVELTLWVDPDEVTCRFGENKGSHCLVAKFKDGELKDNNINLDINNIDIEIFRQAANEGMRQQQHQNQQHQANFQGSPEYGKQHNRLNNSGSINHNGYQYIHHNGSHHSQQNHQHHHHQQQQSSPHHHHHHQSPHRGAKAIFPSYHHGYSTGCDNNGNAVPYYYF